MHKWECVTKWKKKPVLSKLIEWPRKHKNEIELYGKKVVIEESKALFEKPEAVEHETESMEINNLEHTHMDKNIGDYGISEKDKTEEVEEIPTLLRNDSKF